MKVVRIALFTLAGLIVVKRLCVGLDVNDAPFFIHTFTRVPLATTTVFPAPLLYPASYATGRAWAAIAGDSLFAFRCLAVAAMALMALLTYRTLRVTGGDRQHALNVVAAVTLIAAADLTMIFSYDTISSVVLVAIAGAGVRASREPGRRIAFVLGLLSVAAILVRLPNAAVLGPVIVLLLATRSSLRAYASGAGLAAAAGAALILLSADPSAIESAFRAVMVNKSPGGHSTERLLFLYSRDAVGIAAGVGAIGLATRYLPRAWMLAFMAVLGLAAALINMTFAWNFNLLVTACALWAGVTVALKAADSSRRVAAVFLMLVCLVPSVGSDGGLTKTAFVSMFVIAMLVEDVGLPLMLAPAAVVLGVFWSYGDLHSPLDQRHPVDVPKLYGIRTTTERAMYVESIYARYRELARSHAVVVLGEPSNIFYYLFEAVRVQPHLVMNPVRDAAFVDALLARLSLETRPPLVLYLPGGEFDPGWPSNQQDGRWRNEEYRRLASRLRAAGLVETELSDHAVFTRRPAP